MWTIIIAAIIGIFIGVWVALGSYGDTVPGGIFGGIIGALFGLIIALFIPGDYEYVSNYQQLETLTDNQATSGSFFLGCGSIDEKMVYVYYSNTRTDKRGKKYYTLDMLDYNKCEVTYIESNELPMLESTWREETDSPINYFSITTRMERYIFHVPAGTINNSYQLDAQ